MKKENYNIKGIKFISIPEIYKWQYIEKIFKNLIKSYAYDEIKLPLIEKTKIFLKTLGENSDIIQKEMFTFKDKNKQQITLIPEGTTSCLKGLINNGLLRNKIKKKVWYISPMFRRENPQKGRNRLFYQIGLEAFGISKYDIEFEHILIINKFLKILKINNIILEINYINNKKNNNYNIQLIKYIIKNIKNLSILNKNRLKKNPLIILDKIEKKK